MFSITGAIAKTAATRPIHFLVVPALLASVAYLSIVDEYVPSSDGISYYHSPSPLNEWVHINEEQIGDFANCEHITLAPVRFRSFHTVPQLPNAISSNGNEQILLVDNETNLDTITIDGVTWKLTEGHKIIKYYEYLRKEIYKLQESFEKADNFDIILILVAYIAMWYTLIKVFLDIRKLGSKFWLAFSTLVSSTFAFLFALVVSIKLDRKVSLLSLSEGIPFLVAIIGFKHKVSIATVVSKSSTVSPEDVPHIVSQAISSHTLSMFRDHVVVIGALVACAVYANHLTGLRNFCILSAFILAFDLILVHTFYAAILALKIEINRARRTEDLKNALEEEGISSLVAARVAEQSSIIEHPNETNFFQDYSILSFKVVMSVGFIAFNVFWVGSSWMEGRSGSSLKIPETVTIGSDGTLLTILPTRFYVHGFASQVEDFVYLVLAKISDAIKDSLISKFLLFGFGVSIVSNIYFLNAARYQVTATHKLLENEMLKPAEVKENRKDETTFEALEMEVGGGKGASSRDLQECIAFLKDGKVKSLTNSEITSLVVSGKLPLYALEKQLANNARAVVVRRKAIAKLANAQIDRLPHLNYDYDKIFGACCENVVGYMPLPVGVAGPLIIDGKSYYLPMATTEGCLVASTQRGCKAINSGGGVTTVLTRDGMTRGPCVKFGSLARAGAAKLWIDSPEGQQALKNSFNSTSRFARLQHIQTALAGTLLFIRFRTTTGDAMGMNMISKGVEYCLHQMVNKFGFEDMEIISVSGNYCTDKKPAAINWVEGRGKSVVAEARIPRDAVTKVLKSDTDALVELNISKNLVGSAMAGAIGGFNAHAANLVAAVFLACGQDPAQVVESANCITLMDKGADGELIISVSMPSIEVGTIGGGTILDAQGSMLELLGVRGPHQTQPGANAQQLAKIVASTVLAAELSLASALAAGHLVQSHMTHNRGASAPASSTSCIKS
ncbi:HMG1 [Candida oxycetoniae]|uniref:3-hydroxy-3-methylglutaryl coenzyme A reductase n=1 Tax=Candida oxycetoniae TaxID=497107 RepID=A0AAI9SXP2_9ASCO|nr:HMG1 [Candida oxycetoniae]KAI3404646.2 HMG1 [Candida oxycetoniae]